MELTDPEPNRSHNHPPDATEISYTKCRNAMRDQTANSLDKPGQIFAQAMAEVGPEVQAHLPLAENTKRSLHHQRKTPPVPRLSDFTLPEEWRQTAGSHPELFLLYDNGPDSNSRIITFGTEVGRRQLATASTIFMDGNFAMAPTQFSQVYILCVPFRDVAMTCVYALLQNKSRAVYDELFQAVVDKCEEFGLEMDVQAVVTNFEEGVLRAVAGVFGREVQSKGCFYHLMQTTWFKIQQLGLVNHYYGLAFLPIDEVQKVWPT